MSASTLVFFICLFVGCTTLPMTIDLLRVFLPRRLLTGRLVEAWQRPLLLAMVVCLCVWALARGARAFGYTPEREDATTRHGVSESWGSELSPARPTERSPLVTQ